jgi:glutathione S-transferase
MEYLEEVYPEKPLMPKDPITRAKVVLLIFSHTLFLTE